MKQMQVLGYIYNTLHVYLQFLYSWSHPNGPCDSNVNCLIMLLMVCSQH